MNKACSRLGGWLLLASLATQTFLPGAAYALTGGPSQPEMTAFVPSGSTDMVDLFSGDMKYNVPLMDVGGYPVNLSYGSGPVMEDEAGWVGLGWTLNPGSLTRQVRGLPDDFDGTQGDAVQKQSYHKEFRKVGASTSVKATVFAKEIGSTAGVKVNVYKDNYYGIGASVSASLDFSLDVATKTSLTAGIGVESDVRNGVNVNPNFSINQKIGEEEEAFSGVASLSGNLLYNSRDGLKNLSLGLSYSPTQINNQLQRTGLPTLQPELSYVQYFGQSYSPSIGMNSTNSGYTLNLDAGLNAGPLYGGIGLTGYAYRERNSTPSVSVPSFGYFNYVKGRKNKNALLDYNREKDGVFLPSSPVIPVPVPTHDLFLATGQGGSSQFRAYFNGNYTVYDNLFSNTSDNTTFGLTAGYGWGWTVGARVNSTNGKSVSGKWDNNNGFINYAEAGFGTGPTDAATDWGPVGEKVPKDANPGFLSSIGGYDAKRVQVSAGTAYAALVGNGGVYQALSVPMKKNRREKRKATVGVLDGTQASKYGLDKKINGSARVDGLHKAHHISEVTVTGSDGSRTVYGIPVLNTVQKELTFSVQPATGPAAAYRVSGLVPYTPQQASPSNSSGRDNSFVSQTTPVYGSGYLLTGILSPDYRDLTGDGITDDDLGSAVAFRYAKHTGGYQWRAPFGAGMANYNEGFLSDPKDDKASIVYGNKELWYLSRIESKTMVAVFHTSDRNDAIGVLSVNGGRNPLVRQQKLDSVCLYTKPDWLAHGGAAVPVKTVHFEYDYSLVRGVPNNVDNDAGGNPPSDLSKGGKLTLKKVYFTFGQSTRGASNPYVFHYDTAPVNDGSLPSNPDARESRDLYTERGTDRWGSYKQRFYNRVQAGGAAFNNSEFPYTPQENVHDGYSARKLADRLASKWQLDSVTTPTGSGISIGYESDDYAYVQGRRAMQMCFVRGFQVSGQQSVTNQLLASDRIVVELPKKVSSPSAFRDTYLRNADGTYQDRLFFRVLADLDARGHYEYVSGYAQLYNAASDIQLGDGGGTVSIKLAKVEGYNPIAKVGWQLLRTSLPQYAYDNYDNTDVGSDFKAAIKAIVSAISGLGELFKPFDSRANGKKFCNTVDLSRSFVRLNNPDGKKLGGGGRVRCITVSDQWNPMSGGKTAHYGQVYRYTRTEGGREISSGVASYEPQVGNEENPFREPVDFVEKVYWGSDKYHYVEKPFCESYFPAPSVGYSQVRVVPFGDDYDGAGDPTAHTGWTQEEFYTARDFPTRVDYLPLAQNTYETKLLVKLFSSNYTQKVSTSQGFRVVGNDMHGKQKATRSFNQGGDELAATEYFYRTDPVTGYLNNNVDVLHDDGSIGSAPVGVDLDVTTDMRQSANENVGSNTGAYGGGIPFLFFVLPFFFPNHNSTRNNEEYRSISMVKAEQYYGVLEKTRVTQNGSSLWTENLLWDGETGDAVLNRTQTSDGGYNYSFSYPAFRAYDGMAGAYRNLGATLTFPASASGNVNGFSQWLLPGDELGDTSGSQLAWIIRSSDGQLHLVDQNGDFVTGGGTFTVLRSGHRNMLDASVGTVVCQYDPRVGGRIQLDGGRRVMDSKATLYRDEWGVPVAGDTVSCPNGFVLAPDGSYCYRDTAAVVGHVYQVCGGDTIGQYSSCGTAIYSSYNESGTSFTRTFVPWTNAFWINSEGRSDYCGQIPPSSSSGTLISRSASVKKDSLVKTAKASAVTYSGPLNRCGIWACRSGTTTGEPLDKWIGFSKTVNVPATKTYYIGMAADNFYRFSLDGKVILDVYGSGYTDENYFKIWHVYPVELTAGTHIIGMEAMNVGSQASMGAEIYNNTAAEITAATGYSGLDTLFSTMNMVGQPFQNGVYGCPEGYALNTATTPYSCRKVVPHNLCPNPAEKFNPYYRGVLGNWRPWVSYVYHVDRTSPAAGLPVAQAGYYASYTPFWQFAGGGGLAAALQQGGDGTAPVDPRWVWAEKTVHYDGKGNAVESVDPLGRYSCSLYGYLNSLVTGSVANARLNEVAFDGFEDYGFRLSQDGGDPCNVLLPHFDFGLRSQDGVAWVSPSGTVTGEVSHTGGYSYRVNAPVDLRFQAGQANPYLSLLGYDGSGRYRLLHNEQAAGFAPVAGKRYLLSFWVHDYAPASPYVQGLSVVVDGTPGDVSGRVPVVEGWKRVEVVFTAGHGLHLQLAPASVMEFDDFRIAPFDAMLQSYVYDPQTLRLAATLDENNFATLYEYDEEGTPVRVKKETERGIMTLKESRQGYRQHP